jgi:hypothetical protein
VAQGELVDAAASTEQVLGYLQDSSVSSSLAQYPSQKFKEDWVAGFAARRPYSPYFGDCSSTSTPDCRTAREILLAQYWDSAKIEALSRLDTASFCPGCMAHLTECWNTGRKKTWDELPEIFGLPPWSELKKDM